MGVGVRCRKAGACSLLGSEAAVPAAVFSSALIGYLRSAEIASRRVQCAG